MRRILGIDFGEKRIGLALTDPLMMFAYPHDTILNDKNSLDNIAKVIEEFSVTDIVMGYATDIDGGKTTVTRKIDSFADRLRKTFNLPVEFIDERYSSSIAQDRILNSVTSKKKRRDKGLIDKNAAAVILEDYLKNIE